MSRNILLIIAGVEVPESRVDYCRWTALVSQKYNVEIGDGENNPFILQSRRTITFTKNLYRIGSDEPLFVEQQEFIIQHNVEPFMQSELYSSLSERSAGRISEVLRKILKAQSRINTASTELDRLRQLVGTDIQNPQVAELESDRKKRERQLRNRLSELADFTRAKSANLTEPMKIEQIRMTEYWTSDVDEFFETMLEEQSKDEIEREPIADTAE